MIVDSDRESAQTELDFHFPPVRERSVDEQRTAGIRSSRSSWSPGGRVGAVAVAQGRPEGRNTGRNASLLRARFRDVLLLRASLDSYIDPDLVRRSARHLHAGARLWRSLLRRPLVVCFPAARDTRRATRPKVSTRPLCTRAAQVYTSELDMDLSEWLAVLLLLGLLAVVAHTAWTNRNAQEAEGEEFRYMTVTDVMANGSFDDKDG